MSKLTRQDLANNVAESWRKQYEVGNFEWKSIRHDGKTQSAEVVYNNLVKLGDKPNPDDIDKVIGNKSWTELTCDECSESVDEVVLIGRNLSYEKSEAYVCLDCLKRICDKYLGG